MKFRSSKVLLSFGEILRFNFFSSSCIIFPETNNFCLRVEEEDVPLKYSIYFFFFFTNVDCSRQKRKDRNRIIKIYFYVIFQKYNCIANRSSL